MTPYNRKEGILGGLSVLNTVIFRIYLKQILVLYMADAWACR